MDIKNHKPLQQPEVYDDMFRPAQKQTVSDRAVKEMYQPPPDDWLSEEELKEESLKKIAQADALRAYGWFRHRAVKLARWFKLQQAKLKPLLANKKLIRQGLIGVLAIALIWGGVSFWQNRSSSDVLSETSAQAGFDALSAPQNTSAEDPLYDQETGIVAYRDQLAGSIITVSQQPAPPEVAAGGEALQRLTLSFRGTTTTTQVSTNKGSAYVSTFSNGRQRTIFTYNGLLVLIEASSAVPDQSWVDYINAID